MCWMRQKLQIAVIKIRQHNLTLASAHCAISNNPRKINICLRQGTKFRSFVLPEGALFQFDIKQILMNRGLPSLLQASNTRQNLNFPFCL